jgi:hypothetical protein
MSVDGTSDPFRSVSAKVGLLNRQPTLVPGLFMPQFGHCTTCPREACRPRREGMLAKAAETGQRSDPNAWATRGRIARPRDTFSGRGTEFSLRKERFAGC